MDVKNLTINAVMALGLLAATVAGAIEVGRLAERVDRMGESNKAQWERIVAIGAQTSEVDGKASAAVQGLSGLKEAITDLKEEIRLLRRR